MQHQIIDRAEVFLVGPAVERYTWAEGMTEQYMVNIILRLTAKGGLQGIAGAAMITPHGFDRSVGEALRAVLPDVVGASPAYREALWHRLRNFGTPMVPQAHSLIDIALWDMAARHAGLPLYQLLGGRSRDGVLVYGHANGRDVDDTSAEVGRYIEQGYLAVRAQCGVPGLKKTYGISSSKTAYEPAESALPAETVWSTPRYLATVPLLFERLRADHGPGVQLLHDVHHRLTPIEAARLARELEPYRLFWL